MSAPDVLVIGAGITGAFAALNLAEAGAKVTVVDRYGPAAMASGWTLAGVRQSGRHPAELPLAMAAVAAWPTLEETLGAPTRYRQDGNLRLARTPDEVKVIRALVADQTSRGLNLTFLPDNMAVREVAPALSHDILAASFCPTDGHADPHATVSAALGAAMHLGAKLRPGVGVESLKVAGNKVVEVVTNEGRLAAGAVIIAAGVETAALVRPLGAKLPLTIPIVTVVRTAPLPPCLNPVIGVANADLAVRQEVNGRLRLTSGAEPFQNSLEEVNGRPVARPSAVSLRQTLERVEAILPVLREAEIDAVWGGLLDLTPDALPVIDHIKGLENAVVAAGFSGHGFGIGPITGALAADLCLNRTPQMDISAFTFARFNSASTAEPAALTLHG